MWAFLWYLFGSSETVRLSTSAAISLRVVLSAAHPLSAAAKATLYFSLQLKLLHFFNEQIITGRARDIFPALLFASMPQAPVYTNQLSEYQPRHHWYRIQSLCFLELRDLELQASSFVFFFLKFHFMWAQPTAIFITLMQQHLSIPCLQGINNKHSKVQKTQILRLLLMIAQTCLG